MTARTISLLFDEDTARDVDLIRALYDRAAVEAGPPHLPLVAAFEENTPSSDLLDMVALTVAVHAPFVLELGAPESFFDGEEQLLQFVAAKGGEESRKLAGALYRDVFPHHQPSDPSGTPLQRTAITVGRFSREDEAAAAATQLRGKTYFCVMTRVGMLEGDGEGGWQLVHSAELGSMITPG